MVTMPVISRLQISDYELFPGDPPDSGIDQVFEPGPSVIVGINGLGKTTLLMAILRSFTGPFDLTGKGVIGEVSVSLPEKPVALKRKALAFFKQRVADQARESVMRLTATFGECVVNISRRMADLDLIEFKVDGESRLVGGTKAAREESYQDVLAGLMGLGSFVDVLLLLHHVVLFPEGRPGALWDKNAQRHVLRALFLEDADARRVADLERLVQSADSQARNVHTRITATKRELREVRKAQASADSAAAELAAEQKIMEADLSEKERLEGEFASLRERRQVARLGHEKAKIARAEAAGAAARLKYEALARLYPTLHETSRLIVARLLAEDRCLVCDANARERREEIEHLMAAGRCAACGAPPEDQRHVGDGHEFEQARLDRARRHLELASTELSTNGRRLAALTAEHEETLTKLADLSQSIEDRRLRSRELEFQLSDAARNQELEHALSTLRRQHREWQATLARHVQALVTLFEEKKEVIRSRAESIVASFEDLTSGLLAESARLVEEPLRPRYTQAASAVDGEGLQFPAYEAEMVAAVRPTYVRREDPSDVSESQRELIDLAFRLSLLRVAAPEGDATFVMETPEASLDAVAMTRVGSALLRFSEASDSRVIVTSNLSNAGLVRRLLMGPAGEEWSAETRSRRMLNLLRVAAPNRALVERRSEYESLLDGVVQGTGG